MQTIIDWVLANKVAIVMILFLLSEALSFIPQVAANGVFQAIFNAVKWLKAKVIPALLEQK
jgi:hypothetical protein